MENLFAKEYTILPGSCDSSGALGVPDTFALFMDIASEHAEALGCGAGALLSRGLFWLTVRTRVRFFRRPKLTERVTARTWPEPPHRLRADRCYRLEAGTELLAAGKTEWAVLDTQSGRLRPAAEVFPSELSFYPESVWDEPFTRLTDEALEPFAAYTVRSTDIDLGGHMNNAAYVRMLAGAFSCADWQALDIHELEIAFRAPCYEGEELRLEKKTDGSTILLRAARPDGKAAVLARILTGETEAIP